MIPPKRSRPACEMQNGPRGVDHQLGSSSINSSNTPKSTKPQAPDNRGGEDDWSFFRANPNARIRNRLPFEGEFSPEVMRALGHTVMIRATIKRDDAGQPTMCARNIFHVDGGNA
jgi:hypothetical protein